MTTLKIESPTVLRISTALNKSQLEKHLQYHDKKVDFELNKFKHATWFVGKYGREVYEERLQELKDSRIKSILFEDDKGFWTYSGMREPLERNLNTPPATSAVVYPEPKTIPWEKKPFDMYPYQQAVVSKLLASKHAGVEIMTGGGKSLCITYLLKELGLKTLVMAPSVSIAKQLFEGLKDSFGARNVGFYGDGKKDTKKLFTIGIAASLTRIEPESEAWKELSKCEVFVADECFPYESGIITDKGPMAIGRLVNMKKNNEPMPKVLSFNLSTRSFEYKNILNAWSSPMKDLVDISFTNSAISCTLNHRVLTKKGWTEAKDIKRGDTVLGFCSKNMCKNIAPYVHEDLEYKLHPQSLSGKKYIWSNTFASESEFLVTDVSEPYQIKKSSRNGRHNSLYDLEIEDNHNFIVTKSRRNKGKSGIIAHNCHLTPAVTQAKVCFGLVKQAPYRFFFSGTQMRNDGLDMLLQAITGPMVHKMSVRQGVEQGYLAKLNFTMMNLTSDSHFESLDVNEMTRTHLYYNPKVNRIAGKMINNFVDKLGYQVLVLIDEINQFTSLLPYLRHEVGFAHGGVKNESLSADYQKSDPSALVKRFNEGNLPILIGTSCISIGTDIKANKVTINLRGGKSEIEVMQGAIGRSTRKHSLVNKDTCEVIDFDIYNIRSLHRHALDRRRLYEDVAIVKDWKIG